jgi:hypothetical protein
MNLGINRLLADLKLLGYNPEIIIDSTGLAYALITSFVIPAGRFEGKVIDLAIPAPADFGRMVGSSMHIRSKPILMDYQNVPNIRNVIASNLGADWRYWSFAFKFSPTDPTQYLLAQIVTILKNV